MDVISLSPSFSCDDHNQLALRQRNALFLDIVEYFVQNT